MIGIKTKRRIIAFLYHSGIIVVSIAGFKIGSALNSHLIAELSAALLLFHLSTFRVIPVSRWIQEKLIRDSVCLGCGTVIELVSLYRCGCGFMSYKERHVFSPCPMCKKYFSWLNCPVCQTSIPI